MEKKNHNYKVSVVETKPDPAREFFVDASSDSEAKKLAEDHLKSLGQSLDTLEIKVAKVEPDEDGELVEEGKADEAKSESKKNKKN